ncbi:hypothetical protein VMCG_08242 [Cytospora schulzeri]|uniref:Heterokaryon incompatibility domain-containing protein n=1 Tax=Cytospora schulzeri TaxID=448051 RepID=A0A423VSR4_9PEZI|nr:hypothetical protein VMCG_08242 [Valsa malicola]
MAEGEPENSPNHQIFRTTAAHDNDGVDFRHQPLPDKDHIRLIEVLDINDDGVRCQLTCWPINNAPQYDAISYAWGDPNLRTLITINDRRLAVTQNCEYVLRQARWHGMSRYHWVDAICIDQKNNSEKTEQVSRMADIYRDAQRVLACVGTHDDSSRLLFSFLRSDANTRRIMPWLEPASC